MQTQETCLKLTTLREKNDRSRYGNWTSQSRTHPGRSSTHDPKETIQPLQDQRAHLFHAFRSSWPELATLRWTPEDKVGKRKRHGAERMIWNGKKRNVILILFGAPSLCDRGIVWRSKRDRFIYAKEKEEEVEIARERRRDWLGRRWSRRHIFYEGSPYHAHFIFLNSFQFLFIVFIFLFIYGACSIFIFSFIQTYIYIYIWNYHIFLLVVVTRKVGVHLQVWARHGGPINEKA